MTEQTQPPAAPARRRRPGCLGWGVGIVGGLVLAGILVAVIEKPDPGSKYGAIDVCHQFVDEQLKAPATAKYSAETAVGSSPDWTVYGAVDAENGFGAELRNYYRCDVHWISGKKWETTRTVQLGDAPYGP